MPPQTTTQASVNLEQKLMVIAKDVLQVVQLAVTKVALNHAEPNTYVLPQDKNTFEKILQARFQRVSDVKKNTLATEALMALRAPLREGRQRLSTVRNIDFQSAVPIESQTAPSPRMRELSLTMDELVNAARADVFAPAAAAANPLRQLELRIHRVRCADETGGWPEWGSDEIRLGGTGIDETGDTHKINDFAVASFDDGDVKTYSPPKSFTTFRLTEGNQFPKQYLVVFVLAEQDQGGVSDFIYDLTGRVKEEIAKRLADLAGQVFPPIVIFNEQIRKAVKWVLDKVVGYLLRLWEDDIFPLMTVSILIPSLTHRWNGNAKSPVKKVTFEGHRGKYEVYYDWQMFN